MNKRVLLAIITGILLTGCGVKDPSFYDLKSPCVSANSMQEIQDDPCLRATPMLNQLYSEIIS